MYFLIRPDAELVWRDKEVRRRLSRYYDILKNKRIARYLIAKKTPAEETDNSLDMLWDVHNETRNRFLQLLEDIDKNKISLSSLESPKFSFLDLKIKIANEMLKKCNFCERKCGVNRLDNEIGVCGVGYFPRVSSAFLHMGEEAPLVPSGTIFFAGCPFKCVFCQNYDISQFPDNGVITTPIDLAKIADDLKSRGARNINYVGGDPIPNLHAILESLKFQTKNVAQLWNSNLYNSVESLELILDVMDIWLPDFKYGNNKCAQRLSKVLNYFDVVSRNHKIISDYGGEIIIRHLVLPNHVGCCTSPILEWIAKNVPTALVNVMEQYRPMWEVHKNERYKDINRRPTSSEMKKAYEYADSLGIVWRPVS
ncbi:MAG: radical SAM protein [Candidatus Asgardarchaeia archaeon]